MLALPVGSSHRRDAGSGDGSRAAHESSAGKNDELPGQAGVSPVTSPTSIGAITIDDVLDLHDHLASFDGDFHRLFQSGQPGPDG